ncbi:MAG: glycosyltransferase [Acidobacteriota bacterium]
MKTEAFPGRAAYDLVCFSHLRWDFVYQRPQHLLSRFAKDRRVFFIEEPVFHDEASLLEISPREDQLSVVIPRLTHGSDVDSVMRGLLDHFLSENKIDDFVSWYYTPMMTAWTDHLQPQAVVFDVMDELSAFKNAPAELLQRERQLFGMADLVFTGGSSLYESKRGQHHSVYCFPSSIDVKHFARALDVDRTPDDQASIPGPRVGFFGVIDERTDIDLLGRLADLRPDINFVMIGPVVKISEDDLPRRENIHYLGGKDYLELPDYIAGWDVAMMPFAINESTRFISPTKTPEYLAAGRPVVSTAITDVVTPYGEAGLVYIAETPGKFAAAIDAALADDASERRRRASEFLGDMSWDKTYSSMADLIDDIVKERSPKASAMRV